VTGADPGPAARRPADLGPNVGLIEEMYRLYREDPSRVSEAWREFLRDYEPPVAPGTPGAGRPPPETPAAPATGGAPRPATPPPAPVPTATPGAAAPEVEEPRRLTGAAARLVEHMEASLAVPTATSVREVPAKLLEVNRQILNNHLARIGRGKVSFTHLIAYAAVRAVEQVPAMLESYVTVDGRPGTRRARRLNLGLAVDLRDPDGTRRLVVPNIKAADQLDFAAFFAAYEDVIRRVRAGRLSPDDLAGTTATITNPGMIGTVHSVPRLMAGQSFILGVGSIGPPAAFAGSDPATLARLGVGDVVTLTSTYDHRVIQGATSGEFLGAIHRLLLGEDGFYDEVFASFAVPYEPARWSIDTGATDDPAVMSEKVVHVHQLINMYRVRGHLIANLDPLGRRRPHTHPELDVAHYGLGIWDLDREFPVGSLGAGRLGRARMPLREILGVLRDAYARTVGVEYMHIQEPAQKEWVQAAVEVPPAPLPPEDQRRILDRLGAAEAFEEFLHAKFLGQKRFSLEGAESLIPMLDALLSAAADAGVTDAVLGMAHRGRLNVLVNVLGKGYRELFATFEGIPDPASVQGSGDVQYHLGAVGEHRAPSGRSLRLRLASNPSHLEAVDPVVEGMARALGDRHHDLARHRVLPVLIHGDAAFAGQGVVAETLNLSEVPGYEVGGTVHVVVNNQLGFTTAPELGRSSVYATDVAKMVQAPIFHTNGDDPEACVRVIRLAFAFRQRFHKDVVVDLVCYRRWGHNEADEPAFTQPIMYELIRARRTVRKLYTETLVNRGDLSLEEAEVALQAFRERLDAAFGETRALPPPPAPPVRVVAGPADEPDADETASDEPAVPTAIPEERLARIVEALASWPPTFSVHPKLERLLKARRDAHAAGVLDWPLAELCALGAMALEGTPVRLCGQDTRRGTFSQRHAVLIDRHTEEEYCALAHLDEAQAPVMIFDSVLSEYAALGFEYGYSLADPEAFVAWEAQFGDFANVAQPIIDQFIAAAADKWRQSSTLTLLLPHGFEGQGPEHSSARLERFLALCAEGNLRVAVPSTAAQYFHLLRRQVRSPVRRPLVCLTPKRGLREPATRSPVTELLAGGFRPVLDDPSPPPQARRVIVCTGKVAHELLAARGERPVAVVRVEQLAPWPAVELAGALAAHPDAEVVWAQEEPANMGAWSYVAPRLRRLAGSRPVRRVCRPPSASPATGSFTVHRLEQEAIIDAALTGA
jgi:2-oxoglutarate dehydrogenase E1 component